MSGWEVVPFLSWDAVMAISKSFLTLGARSFKNSVSSPKAACPIISKAWAEINSCTSISFPSFAAPPTQPAMSFDPLMKMGSKCFKASVEKIGFRVERCSAHSLLSEAVKTPLPKTRLLSLAIGLGGFFFSN
eukprot:Lithocolla_globosa_v1_NODE_3203_length_1734_cov_4.275759.p2 type:complete len:132 gc:universal NODE_3203_length_1734_cov_4.275759:877-1272(+)